MCYDIVCPDGNEDQFIEMAKRLGFRGICFIYKKSLPKNPKKDDNLEIFYGIETKDAKKAENFADFVIAKDIEDPRQHVEKSKPDVIFGVEKLGKKDFMHQRNSGVDNVICEIAKKKNSGFGFNVNDFVHAKDPKLFGRAMQNIRLFEKHNVNIFICSLAKEPMEMKNPRDIESFFSLLGLKNSKESLNRLKSIIKNNEKIRKGLLTDGVEVVN